MGPATALRQIVYVSSAVREMADEELAALLVDARVRNAAAGVTGMLLYSDETFMQVIEGAPDVTGELFARIARDPRHARVITIVDDPVPARSFATWSMGFRSLVLADLLALPGFSDFLMQGSPLHERLAQSPDAAHRLLTAFRACSAVVPTLDDATPQG